jgi:FkbH-like protein
MEQHQSGMLLCLCSKNNEEDVWDVFERRREMPLRRDHIVSSRINWKPKSENLRSLAAELNLGLDSFIFIDDDPSVCAEVCVNCPEVLTLQLPGEADEIIPCLNHFWPLDRSGMTAEDESRTSLYRVAAERERMRATSNSLEDFLAGLCLEITVSSLRAEDVARVSQLTQRTNQFNFTTIRRSETDIERLCLNGEAECLVVTVVDRFGDYGLVGTTIFRTGKNALEVDTLLLSCRALGRRVEHRMLAELGKIAQARNLDYVDVCFRHTKKNRPAFEFIRCVDSTRSTTNDGSTILRIKSQVAVSVESQAMSSANTQRAVLASPEAPSTNDNTIHYRQHPFSAASPPNCERHNRSARR